VESGMESGKSPKIKVESGVEWPLSTLSGFSTSKWKMFSNSAVKFIRKKLII